MPYCATTHDEKFSRAVITVLHKYILAFIITVADPGGKGCLIFHNVGIYFIIPQGVPLDAHGLKLFSRV